MGNPFRPARSSLTAAAVFLASLFVVGCSETTSPTTSTGAAVIPLSASNSDAAHACQKDGYQNLFRADGSGFKNAGECASYAAGGGRFATRQTATLENVVYSACDNLSLGYELDGVQHILESVEPGCLIVFGANQTIHYLSSQTLRLFLRDDTCPLPDGGWIFYEDGPHGLVVPLGPSQFQVEISDGGGPPVCAFPPEEPRLHPNLSLTKTIS
jgi:hypothetical protein